MRPGIHAPLKRLTAFTRAARRELIWLAIAGLALLLILPKATENNPDYVSAQRFLDRLAAATDSIRGGASQTGDYELAEDGFAARSAALGDGTVGTVLVGAHADRCFLVHWLTGTETGARAGVLDESLACTGSDQLMETLPAPPLVETFPGTVPPLSADQLVSRVNASRHGTVEPFPAQRTPVWFIPAAATLFAVMLWHTVGLIIKLIRRQADAHRLHRAPIRS